MTLKDNLFYGASADTMQKALELRTHMTVAEKILWRRIRNKQTGYKFRRQHPIDIFIADFYCHEKKLVIEVDGEVHNHIDNKEYDIGRTNELKNLGILVLRYKNNDIIECLEAVVIDIMEVLEKR